MDTENPGPDILPCLFNYYHTPFMNGWFHNGRDIVDSIGEQINFCLFVELNWILT